ncbi:uracil-DNA glycosylase [Williamsia sp. 1138]|uniref:uracil-DNA glycosylase n=1 Tax=Williamsia sp. 1138 TaxID=1903117 RepID=UPI000A117D6D|nr:uracil-DNA glycosylase [Williamsia sp. 1138]OZG26383.1 uracil-DNA glycosylase [Williamsia sp. 1138]
MANGRNADPAVVADKMSRIRDAHVAPLNRLADNIADSQGLPRGHVPYVDPDQGGVKARLLVLLDNPSTKAEAGTGSGLLSLDNNDRTARNCREAYARHNVSWSDVVHWNVVPFPVAGAKNGGSTPAERSQAAQWTEQFVDLCPRVEFVLLLGVAARDGWDRATIDRDILVLPGKIPHCSDRGLNSAGGRERFESAVAQASTLLND